MVYKECIISALGNCSPGEILFPIVGSVVALVVAWMLIAIVIHEIREG